MEKALYSNMAVPAVSQPTGAVYSSPQSVVGNMALA